MQVERISEGCLYRRGKKKLGLFVMPKNKSLIAEALYQWLAVAL